jgi:uncharacterized protein (TIGR02145 family)
VKKLTATFLLLSGILIFSCENDLGLNETEINYESQEKSLMLKSANSTVGYIMNLVPMINDLAEGGYLNKGNSNSLINKIQVTVAQLEKDNKNAATNQLKSFISQVDNLKERGSIPVQSAETIINKAGNGLILIKGSFLDIRDGQEYKVVLIGDKIWMAENLKYLPYLSPMPADYPPEYEILNTENPWGMYYVFQYLGSSVEEAKMTPVFKATGALYSYNAAMEASPPGWHLPDNEEWNQLAQYISEKKGPYNKIVADYGFNYTGIVWENVGLHLKSTTGWQDFNGIDDFGFTAVPNGYISPKYNSLDDNPPHQLPSLEARWWSSTDKPVGPWEGPVNWVLNSAGYNFSNDAINFAEAGLAVRCVKD